jgi:hypothetical protein
VIETGFEKFIKKSFKTSQILRFDVNWADYNAKLNRMWLREEI